MKSIKNLNKFLFILRKKGDNKTERVYFLNFNCAQKKDNKKKNVLVDVGLSFLFFIISLCKYLFI